MSCLHLSDILGWITSAACQQHKQLNQGGLELLELEDLELLLDFEASLDSEEDEEEAADFNPTLSSKNPENLVFKEAAVAPFWELWDEAYGWFLQTFTSLLIQSPEAEIIIT